MADIRGCPDMQRIPTVTDDGGRSRIIETKADEDNQRNPPECDTEVLETVSQPWGSNTLGLLGWSDDVW